MLNLFTEYEISEIFVFLIILSLAIKEFVTFYDWAKARVSQGYNKDLKEKENKDKVQQEIDDLNTYLEQRKKVINDSYDQINYLTKQVALLIESDKDSIKSYITKEHHFFCYQQGWIDDYSLDCLEKRYSHYTEEGGNSFVKELMKELRELPKQPLDKK